MHKKAVLLIRGTMQIHFLQGLGGCHAMWNWYRIHKRKVEWRKRFGGDWMTQFGRVWSSPKWWQVRAGISNFIMKYQQIDWQFQCYFIFYKVPSKRADPPISVIPPDCTENLLLSKVIGLDPGKRTMVDADGNVMKYSARQRNFESKLTRFRTVLESEKKKTGIEQLEFSLSQFWATWPLSTRNTLSCKPLWKIS